MPTWNTGRQHPAAPSFVAHPSSAVGSSSSRGCPCGTAAVGRTGSAHCRFELTPASLSSIAVASPLTLAAGGTRHRPLEFAPPPRIALAATDPAAILDMLGYAGVRYSAPDAPAASVGRRVFAAGRALALDGRYDAVTFDWDHTLSNYQVFEDIKRVVRVRRRTSPPSPADGAALMVGIETARPFMVELAFGLMAGFAIRQGLSRLSEWERYRPQVGIATHTWPDRLGLLAAHYTPILALMEGLLPGAPDTYERFVSAKLRSAIHLHHFLGYATALLRRVAAHGFGTLTPVERHEVVRYLEDGAAHRHKPLGAWAMRGWATPRLLHIDDSTRVVADLMRAAALAGHEGTRALHAPHPHSRIFRNVQEWHKVSLPALWRGRNAAIRGAIAYLVRTEWARSPVPALLRALGHHTDADIAGLEAALPAGMVMTMHQTPTSLGELWRYFVEPVNRARSLIREVRRSCGGLRAVRQAARDGARVHVAPAPQEEAA